MAYQCPRCGKPVQRGHSTSAQVAAGLVGALFYAAFGSFMCPTCGKIPQREFPPADRNKMMMHSALMVIGAVVLAVVCIGLIMSMQ